MGHPLGGTGCIGAFVILPDGRPGILSMDYVLSPPRAKRGDMIHQPGPLDRDVLTGQTRAATLLRPILEKAGVTASIAALLPGIAASGNRVPEVFGSMAGRHIGPPTAAEDGVEVFGLGRHGLMRGRITGAIPDGLKIWGNPSAPPRQLAGAIAVAGFDGAFSQPGDAGALVCRVADGAAIGLIAAAGEQASWLLPLAPVLREAKLSWADPSDQLSGQG
ncbi:MAG: hypothetical protein K2X49_07875 [Acetobacteraceae bacterium]|nr:hypothetical protein [Acetobacteraceae bacterium]